MYTNAKNYCRPRAPPNDLKLYAHACRVAARPAGRARDAGASPPGAGGAASPADILAGFEDRWTADDDDKVRQGHRITRKGWPILALTGTNTTTATNMEPIYLLVVVQQETLFGIILYLKDTITIGLWTTT